MPTKLLAVDDDESYVKKQIKTTVALPFATNEITVTICHVCSENPFSASINQIKTDRLAEYHLGENGFKTVFAERSGDPAEQIIEYETDNDIELICLVRRKRSPTGKALFGSTTQDVILGTDCPVLVAGNVKGDHFNDE